MQLSINGQKFPVEMMSSPEEIERGMQGRDTLDGCMGFKLKRGNHTFWMKDCLIPLDIVFVLNGRISKIHKNCHPCSGDDCQRYYGPADHVFEFPAGTCENFKEGDQANLYLGTKFNPA